jgi:hypothetical protein
MKVLAALFLAAAALQVGACSLYGDDELTRYIQRSDKITLSAGDAKDVNATTHTIDPWPRGVGDRRIPANGERMVRAVERYRKGPPQPLSGAGGAAPGAGAMPGTGAAPAAGADALPPPAPASY